MLGLRSGGKRGAHERPYKQLGPKGTPPKCSGKFARVLLGHDFDTDLLLLRLKIASPIVTDTVNGVVLRILEDALHSLAEALRLAASRHRQLDLDPAEFALALGLNPRCWMRLASWMYFCMTRCQGGQGTQRLQLDTWRRFWTRLLSC